MNFWHMNLLDTNNMQFIHTGLTENILRESGVIGLGDWEEGRDKIDQFRNEMMIGDVVAIKEGKTPIALVRVTSDSYDEDNINEELDWFPIRRRIDILDFYNIDYNFSLASRGTLNICSDLETNTSKTIINWYKTYMKKGIESSVKNLLLFKKQIVLQGPPGTGKTYTAKDIAEDLIFGNISSNKIKQMKKLKDSGQFNIIQFHPSYSYEDFVRGITAKGNGPSIEYKTENKVFGEFVKSANKNYENSRKDVNSISEENWINYQFEEFTKHIQSKIDEVGKYPISKSAYIFDIDESGYKYKGDNWIASSNIPFSVILKLYDLGITERIQIEKNKNLKGTVTQRPTYYFTLLEKFREFLSGKANTYDSVTKIEEKKYILIIDEINRANLPAVLGELIYALEYRNEKVDSMYGIDGDRSLSIPPNLYIIGTMNTADRSVGHIDYAIRRRFAFYEMLPSASVIDEVVKDKDLSIKATNLFNSVAELFNSEHLASDFKANQVQLGHSYFLAKDEKDLQIKLEFEIKPILEEYLRDGILLEGAGEIIKNLKL